jgi:hypothetical protein
MPFAADRFDAAALQPRRRTVDVPGLAPWFDEGEAPRWEVRGLTAAELQRAFDAGRRQADLDNVVKALAEGGDRVELLRKALGLSKDVPGEIAKRMEMLAIGSVCPAIQLPTAVKLAEAFPVEFLELTNVITELTGQGFDLGKPAAASQTTPA